jgi:guanylate kinase
MQQKQIIRVNNTDAQSRIQKQLDTIQSNISQLNKGSGLYPDVSITADIKKILNDILGIVTEIKNNPSIQKVETDIGEHKYLEAVEDIVPIFINPFMTEKEKKTITAAGHKNLDTVMKGLTIRNPIDLICQNQEEMDNLKAFRQSKK